MEPTVEPLWTTAHRSKPEGCWFDEREADRAVEFFPLLQHTLGEWAGKPFVLTPDQEWATRELFGWRRSDGLRLYRTMYVETGRGNGKTEWGAGLAGKLLYADGEPSAEVIGAAADRKQARICLERLKGMAGANLPPLERGLNPLAVRSQFLRSEIRVPRTSSTYRVMSADVRGSWGLAPSAVVFDEVHAQPNRELWDALATALGKRTQPLMIALTTAGWDRESLAWELHEYTRQIAQGTASDPSFLGIVWAAPEEADWTDPATWRRANPGLGVMVKEEFLRAECEKARVLPAFQNTFRTMYLSQWVGQEVRMIPMEQWDACTEAPAPPSRDRPAFGGLDLASTTDLAAFTIVRERDGKLDLWRRIYVPQEGLRDRGLRDRVPYEAWARDGLITATPGKVIDYAYIRRDVLEAKAKFDLRDVGYDRWNSSQLVQELESDGVTMVEVGQGFGSLSTPTKELLRRTVSGELRHGGDPVLRWMANNSAAQVNAAGDIKPDKSRASGRIDGIVSTIIAIDGWVRRGQTAKRVSAYANQRGLTVA